MIGPDYNYSLAQVAMANLISFFAGIVPSIYHELDVMVAVGFTLLICQNTAFGLTVFLNPGLPPRDPQIHSKSYINRVKTVE